ncbi:MAG TPA: hypothetical protein VN637_09300 [Roseiarcus sp.]|jgi:hypothetical protein|nr:hypothetical protein [Roseiarcus sp.]HXE25069.1 hypothetical protein [Roseiarcus sp.]
MVSHALFHQWPGATPRTKGAGSAAKSLQVRQRRLALVESLIRRRSEPWMTEEAAAAEHHPTLLEDNPSSG